MSDRLGSMLEVNAQVRQPEGMQEPMINHAVWFYLFNFTANWNQTWLVLLWTHYFGLWIEMSVQSKSVLTLWAIVDTQSLKLWENTENNICNF